MGKRGAPDEALDVTLEERICWENAVVMEEFAEDAYSEKTRAAVAALRATLAEALGAPGCDPRWADLRANLEELADSWDLGRLGAPETCRDLNHGDMGERCVDRIRRAGTLSTDGHEKLVVWPAGQHERTFIFLHGFKMHAQDLLEDFIALSRHLPSWRFVLPQAPEIPISAHGGEVSTAWFDYLTDHNGAQEDTIDIFSLRKHRAEVFRLVSTEAALVPGGMSSMVLGGMSQGGSLALHLATTVTCKAVVTLVSCRLSHSKTKPLECPWHALLASGDDVFPDSWARPLMAGVTSTEVVEDSHYLEKTEVVPFLEKTLRALG